MSNLAKLQEGQQLYDASMEIHGEIYNLKEMIGSGGTAFAYKALDAEGKTVVVKVYKNGLKNETYQEIARCFGNRRQHPYIANTALIYPHAGKESSAVVYNYVKGKPAIC